VNISAVADLDDDYFFFGVVDGINNSIPVRFIRDFILSRRCRLRSRKTLEISFWRFVGSLDIGALLTAALFIFKP